MLLLYPPSMHCLLAFPDGCYWFESNGFANWTIDNNTFNGCGNGNSDIFVAACAPIYDKTSGLPTKNGNPITVGQPFADGKIVNNHFLQHDEPHHAVEVYGFNGLVVQDNVIELVTDATTSSSKIAHPTDTADSMAMGGADLLVRDAVGLCGDLCGSLDGFDVSSDYGAQIHGWVVDVKLSKPNISSYVTIKVDGKAVLTTLASGLRPDLVGPVSKEPQHGFAITLPDAVGAQLLTGNHTLAVLARRQDGSSVRINEKLLCVNEGRRQCAFPTDCSCGAPLPSRMLVSNSIACQLGSNVCDGKPCTTSEPAGGCKP
jgi:hypothetical protein